MNEMQIIATSRANWKTSCKILTSSPPLICICAWLNHKPPLINKHNRDKNWHVLSQNFSLVISNDAPAHKNLRSSMPPPLNSGPSGREFLHATLFSQISISPLRNNHNLWRHLSNTQQKNSLQPTEDSARHLTISVTPQFFTCLTPSSRELSRPLFTSRQLFSQLEG